MGFYAITIRRGNMGVLDDLKWEKFGTLLVVKRIESSKNGHAKWVCACICGKYTEVFASNLKRGHTTSCGCANDEVITKHGLWGTPTYWVWHSMLQRCNNPRASHYCYYGGRGIKVCEAWHLFENFIFDMGERPADNLTIDRKDNNQGYSKDNCRWVTQSVQNYNKRSSAQVKYDNVKDLL